MDAGLTTVPALARALAVGRVGLGTAAAVAPRLASLPLVGRAGQAGVAPALVRLVGTRDVALGLAALQEPGDAGQRRRHLLRLAAAVDAADALVSAAAIRRHSRVGGLLGTLSGGAAALVGLAAAGAPAGDGGSARRGRARRRGPLAAAVDGAVAGAVATTALNVVTYLDMAVRGRAASGVPAAVAGAMTDSLGIDLAGPAGVEERADNRREALGALSGMATGIASGVAYGLLVRDRPVSVLATGLVTGGAVMALTDSAAITSGATDPRTWGVSGWLADIVPHAVFGVVLAAVHHRLGGGGR